MQANSISLGLRSILIFAAGISTLLLCEPAAFAESGRRDHDAMFIPVTSDWKRTVIKWDVSQPKQYGLGDRIWYSKNHNTLNFFTLTMPGQAVTAAFMDAKAKGPHTLDKDELKLLGPLYEQTSEHGSELLSGKVSTIGGKTVLIFDGEWSWYPCSQARRGMKPGEKLITELKRRTVVSIGNSKTKFEGIDFQSANDEFDAEVKNFEALLANLKWNGTK